MAAYNTRQKKMIEDFMLQNSENQFTVEELAKGLTEALGAEAPGKSTVYRLINRMVDDGEVKRFVQGNSRHFRYQINASDECRRHLHLKCTLCGRLLHMDSIQSREILQKIEGESRFYVDSWQTTLFGRCALCAGKKNDGRKAHKGAGI